MILGEKLRRKYALTSLKPKGATLTILAINEALEAAAQIADRENLPVAASHIRCLKWLDKSMAGDEIVAAQRGGSLVING